MELTPEMRDMLTLNNRSAISELTHLGDGVARFISRAQAGEDLAITCVGDSVLEGTTVTTPPTDGAMIKLAAALSVRFGITVTQTNHAHSGDTVMRSYIGGYIDAAINENADLYIVSAYDKNDLGQDIGGQWAAGYNLAASVAAIERVVRTIRAKVPKADVIIMSTNPYSGAAVSANPYQLAKDNSVKRIAAVYGCEWVDCYAAFAVLRDWSALMYDDTHPNTAGHALMSDTLLAHFPNVSKSTSYSGEVADNGLYSPEKVAINKGNGGYVTNSSPGTFNEVTYTTGGTGWVDEATSTAGDYIEVSANATEIAIQISTAAVDATVVDIYVDNVLVDEDVNLSTQGKQGTYWIPFATGLAPAAHKVKLTLKSGTLRTFTVSALMSAYYDAPIKVVSLFTGSANYTLTAAYADVITDVTVPKPAGWASMNMVFDGTITFRSTADVAAIRTINQNIKVDSVTAGVTQTVSFPATSAQLYVQAPIAVVATGITAANPVVQFQAQINDGTNPIKILLLEFNVLLIRTA